MPAARPRGRGSFSGSSTRSISAIRSSSNTKLQTACGDRDRPMIRPAAPLTIAWCASGANVRRVRHDLLGDGADAADRALRQRAALAGIDAEDDVRVEHREQRVEVGRARRGEERVDDLPLPRRGRRSARGSAPCTRRRARLASWRVASRGALDDRRDLVERHARTCRAARRRAARSGVRVSSTTSIARPTESAISACCSGFVGVVDQRPSARAARRRRQLLGARAAGAQHVEADARRRPS